MMPNMPSPAQQKAQLTAHQKELNANLAVLREQASLLIPAMHQFDEASQDMNAVHGTRTGARVALLASGLCLLAKSQLFVINSNIMAIEAQLAAVEKILTRLESPVYVPILTPNPGGRG